MAGITYFVALPFDVADDSSIVGEPMKICREAIIDDLKTLSDL
jgi:hypothetical protein